MKTITLLDANDQILSQAQGENAVSLTFDRAYQAGDHVVFTSDEAYVYAGVDAFLQPAYLYLPEGKVTYRIPTDAAALEPYHPLAFRAGAHTCFIAGAAGVKGIRRDLALNPMAQRAFEGAYPFAHANVETRDESVFFARNVIDGIHLNNSHGPWPYESWGIGLSETAEISIDFGREVTIDSMKLTLRADFPHDAYWKQATVTLSDGYSQTFTLDCTADAQEIRFDRAHTVTSIRLHSLVKQVMDSPFPALRCWEVIGIG